MAKQPKAKVKQVRNVKNLRIKLLVIPVIALLIKLIIITKIPGHAWLGADGENYLTGVDGLLQEGLFSTNSKLSYWPAGYPLLMVFFSYLHKPWILIFTSVLQSILYFVGCAYFADLLLKTRIRRFAFYIAFILAFNPTISLNSIAIGYEVPSAALFLLAISFLIKNYYALEKNKSILNPILSAICFMFISFMQPRLIICGILILFIWGLAEYRGKSLAIFLLTTLIIVAVAPTALVLRNVKAIDAFTISTNLGVTMNIGAGDKATGGYMKADYGVPCTKINGTDSEVDKHLTGCVINWYLHNPAKGIKLFTNKAFFYWSPWFGPVANGTMARNPWLKIQPFKDTLKTQEGINMVYGNTGKLVSWIWLLGQLFFMFSGFWFLWRSNGLERLLGTVALGGVVINWLTSIATIGDHRFRIPTMTLSLFLQVIGFVSLFGGKSRLTGSVNPLRWKSLERKANLLP